MWWSDGSGRIELEMTLKQARSASHPGPCDADVTALAKVPKIARQLKKINPEQLRATLKEYGAYEEKELANHDENLERILWIAAGDISDDHTKRRTNE